MGQGGHHANNCQSQSMSGTMSVGQGSQRKTSNLANNAHASGNGMFNMTLKEVKKEPGETMSCSKHLDGQMSHENMFPNRYGEDSGEQMMDPELQELFNELTNISVPPMSDLELENMINATIKQDEPFNIDLGQQSQRGPVRSLQMDKMVIKSEYAPGMNQASVGSPQMRPSSTGPAFTMATAAMSTSSPIPSVPQNQTQVSQVSSASSRPLPNWQEVSHAQQLKQIAANRQQHALIQQQQQQQNQTANWSTLSPSGPSPGPFVQEKIPSPSFRQQQFSPQSSAMLGVPVNGNQSKGMNNYVYKPTTPQSNPMDIIMQQKPQDLNRNFINSAQPPLEQHHGNTKPLFHFNSEQTNQQMPSVLGSQSKPALLHYTQQSQSSAPVQQPQQQQQPQPQPAQPLPNQSLQRPPNVPLAMQQKMMLQKIQQSQQISGLQYPVSQQHRQVRQILPSLLHSGLSGKKGFPSIPHSSRRCVLVCNDLRTYFIRAADSLFSAYSGVSQMHICKNFKKDVLRTYIFFLKQEGICHCHILCRYLSERWDSRADVSLFWTPVWVSYLTKFLVLLNGTIVMNSYVILENAFYNVNFYVIDFLREAGLGNSVFRYRLTDMTKILFAHLLSVWQRKTKTYLWAL